MYKSRITFTLACILLACAWVQLYGWTKTYGSEDYDDVPWCVRPTSDGGYIMSGSITLIKTDRWGDSLWTKDYAGSGRFVEQTSDGGYVVTGIKDGDFWLLKADENGDSLWAKTYSGSDSSDYPRCIRQTFDAGYIWLGTKNTNPWTTQRGSLWFLKLNSSGDTLWTRTYAYPDEQSLGWSVCQTADSGYVISGCVNDNDGRHVWLLKADAQGDTLWTRKYGEQTYEGGHCVQPTADGGYILVGDTSDPLLDPDLWLLKTNSTGDILWSEIYATPGHDIGYWVEEASDSGYIISGIKNWQYEGRQVCNIWLLRTDKNGDTLWTREYGGDYSDWGHSVCEASDGGYLIGAVKDYDAPGDSVRSDMWLLKTNPGGDTVWYQVSPIVILDPEEGETIHKMIPEAWFKNTGTMITEDFYCHCEIYSSTYHTPDYHASYWISFPVELGDSVLVKFPEWLSDDSSTYIVRFYTTCEAEPWWSCKDMTITFQGSPYEGVEEGEIPTPTWELVRSYGPHITLRYIHYPEGFQADIFDATGRKVDEVQSSTPSGTITWPVTPVTPFSPGVYFIRPLSGNPQTTRKVVLIR